MFDSENINYVELKLLQGQIDLILLALELYAFNFHKVWAIDKDSDLEDLRNSLLFHTYEEILIKSSKSRVTYDVLYNCKLEKDRKRRYEYNKIKKVA